MKKIGNIVSSVELSNHKKMDWINYFPSIEFCNMNLPTLIIGWDKVKRTFGHYSPNILKKKFDNTSIYWEFSMEEKITDHFTGVENFVKIVPRAFVELFRYKSIDPIGDKIESIEQLWAIVTEAEGRLSYYQYKDEIIYVFNHIDCKIYGIYLTAFKYFGLDNKIIANFFDNKIIAKTIDSDGSIYQSYYRQFPDFDQLKRAMVLFLM